jgi:tetratricopeptide (TPR) repeat protein
VDAARGLAEAGLLRYQGGAWLIESDPAAIEAHLARRHEGYAGLLSADAEELLSVLALDRERNMSLADYAALTVHGDSARVHRALNELVQAGLLLPLGDRHRFVREAERAIVVHRMGEERRRELHVRLGERALVIDAPPIHAVYHFLSAKQLARAVAPLVAFREIASTNPAMAGLRATITLDTLETLAGLETDELGMNLERGASFVVNATYQGVPERAVPHIRPALAHLSVSTGLEEFRMRTDLEPSARLGAALAVASAHCYPTTVLPDYGVIVALRRLCQLAICTAVCARFVADPTLLDDIPDLSPYATLSPAIGMTQTLVDALGKIVRGQDWAAWDALKKAYGEMRASTDDSVDALTRFTLENVLLGYLCAYECEHATEAALNFADAYAPAMPNLAESHRSRYYLSFGDLSAASAARRRFELLSVQANGLLEARLTQLPSHLTLYALSDDILGLERTVAAIEKVVQTRPGWRARLLLGRGHLLRSRGEIDAALRLIESALDEVSHVDPAWPQLAALQLDLLNRAHRPSDVIRRGPGCLEHAAKHDFPTALLELALAEAHAEEGEHDDAERHFNVARVALASRGARGLPLGHCYEVGARIALKRGARDTFSERMKACAMLYRCGHNPALSARYDALVRDASRQDGAFDGPSRLITASGDGERSWSDRTATIVDGGARYLEVLRRVSQEMGALGGVLYANTNMGLVRRHTTIGLAVPESLDEEIGRYFANEMAAELVTGTHTAVPEVPTSFDLYAATNDQGDRFIPCLLEFRRNGVRHVAGVATFAVAAETRLRLAPDGLEIIATQLAQQPNVVTVPRDD